MSAQHRARDTHITPCAGQTALFESTNLTHARQAAEICRTQCWRLEQCAQERDPNYQGTWAGELFSLHKPSNGRGQNWRANEPREHVEPSAVMQAFHARGYTEADVMRLAKVRGYYDDERRTFVRAIDDIHETHGITFVDIAKALKVGETQLNSWRDRIKRDDRRIQAIRETRAATEIDHARVELAIDKIRRGVKPERRELTRAERVELVRRWRAAGKPARVIELVAGWKVERYKDGAA